MEYQENGVGTYDFHARMYDPQIGRSFQPDPMADVSAYKSPYAFLANNPVMFIDPTGMLDVTAMYFDDERFQAIYPSNTSIPRDWHRNTGKNFRGAGGFYAAFNPRGQWSAENARNTWRNNYKFEKIDKYTDSYFYSKYTGLRYKGTKYEGSYLVLANADANAQGGEGTLQVDRYQGYVGTSRLNNKAYEYAVFDMRAHYTSSSSMKGAKWIQIVKNDNGVAFFDGDPKPFYMNDDYMNQLFISGNSVRFEDSPTNLSNENRSFRADLMLYHEGKILLSIQWGYDYNSSNKSFTPIPYVITYNH